MDCSEKGEAAEAAWNKFAEYKEKYPEDYELNSIITGEPLRLGRRAPSSPPRTPASPPASTPRPCSTPSAPPSRLHRRLRGSRPLNMTLMKQFGDFQKDTPPSATSATVCASTV